MPPDLRLVPPGGVDLAARDDPRRARHGRRAIIQVRGGDRRGPGAARRAVRARLTEWQAPAEAIDTLEQVVSELVTNAILHTASDRVAVLVALRPEAASVAVVDHGPYVPLRPELPEPTAEPGRGLPLVDLLADRWGHQPHGTGSRIWAAVDLPRTP